MEYIIIFVLLVFLIIIILKKQILFINNIKNTNEKTIIKYNNLLVLNKNPILLYLYENFYTSLKKINKYNYKKYIIFSNIKLSNNDKNILDWCSYTGGMINMAIESSIKHLKQKKTMNHDIINNLARLKLFYKIFFPLKNENFDKIKKYNKYGRYIRNNRFIYNLVYINEVLYNIYNDIIKTINKDDIKKILNENKNNYYLCNIILNNRIKQTNTNKKSDFYKYIIKSL